MLKKVAGVTAAALLTAGIVTAAERDRTVIVTSSNTADNHLRVYDTAGTALPLLPTIELAAATALAGLVGDDYGRPTNLPWGIAFPEGLPPTAVPVHPTQLYEAAALVPLVILLMRWRRRGRPARFVLGAYLVLAGVIRFAIEFLRVNERVLGALSVAHVASLGVMVIGGALLLDDRRRTLQGELRRREHHT